MMHQPAVQSSLSATSVDHSFQSHHSNHCHPQSNSQPSGPSSSQDSMVMNYEHLGNIVVRLLPQEYQAERLPDGRYVLKAAAIGYLAQKLGH